MSPSLQVRIGQHSEAGRKPENQDSIGVRYPEGELLTTKGLTAVVADGVSASASAREAAEACVTGFLSDYYSTPDSWTVETSASRVLGALNRWLHGKGQTRHGDERGMVSTFSAVILRDSLAVVLHIGDSRVYRLRQGELECITRDHSVRMGRDGEALARAMGMEPNVEIDVRRMPLEAGDRFLLTTDGVHDWLDEVQLTTFAALEDPEEAARQLVRAAYDEGSTDNLSAQVLGVDELPTQDIDGHYARLTELPFPPPLVPGQRLDGFRIIRELHASRRTQVYLVAPDDGGEPLVMKTPSPNYVDDAAYIDRFLTEAWVLRRVRNPHVVEYREPPQQRQCLYFLTEYIEGPTLREWMNDHPRPSPSVVRDIVRQIAIGVRALHRLEMIHQDLKPENIVIDREGTVKLIDLGAVRIPGTEDRVVPWQQSGYLGTEGYAAPECLAGDRPTMASDRYALGMIAYELMTGELPYRKPPYPSYVRRLRYTSARHHQEDIPLWLDACLRKAVSLKPEQRYPTLSEFLHDLEHPNPRLLDGEQPPLVERVPPENWRFIAGVSLLLNLLFVLWIVLG